MTVRPLKQESLVLAFSRNYCIQSCIFHSEKYQSLLNIVTQDSLDTPWSEKQYIFECLLK